MKLNEVTELKAGDLEQVQNYESSKYNTSLFIGYENLTSLEGCPKEIIGDFNCTKNNLTSLEGCPEIIGKHADFSRNKLTSLKGCPKEIYGVLNLWDNQLTSFEYFPNKIYGILNINENRFTSFKDIDQHIEYIGEVLNAAKMNITSGFSDLFGIDGLWKIVIDNNEIEEIVNKYLEEKDLIEFQDEMIKAGYESYL